MILKESLQLLIEMSFSLKLANINNIPAHCNQILSQKAMECAIICQRSSL